MSVNVEQTVSSSIKPLSSGLSSLSSSATQNYSVNSSLSGDSMETDSLALDQESGLPKQDVSALSNGSMSTRKDGGTPFSVEANGTASTARGVEGDNTDVDGRRLREEERGNGDKRKNTSKASAKKELVNCSLQGLSFSSSISSTSPIHCSQGSYNLFKTHLYPLYSTLQS